MGEHTPSKSGGEKVQEFLARSGFLNTFHSPKALEEWMQDLSYSDFKSHLVRLNGMLCNAPIKPRSMDGTGDIGMSMPGVEDVAYLPPHREDRDHLLAQVFENLKKIKNSKDKALLLYYAIQAIHPFSDGNGRTGRFLYTLLSANAEEVIGNRLALLIDDEKGGDLKTVSGRNKFAKQVLFPQKAYYYLQRELAKEILENEFLNEYGAIYISAFAGQGRLSKDTATGLGEETARTVKNILGEESVACFSMRALTIMSLIREYPELAKYQYDTNNVTGKGHGVVGEDLGKKTHGIEGEDLMEALTPEQARRTIEIHRHLKQRFIAIMIDVFVHPDAHQAKKNNALQPLKEFLKPE